MVADDAIAKLIPQDGGRDMGQRKRLEVIGLVHMQINVKATLGSKPQKGIEQRVGVRQSADMILPGRACDASQNAA